MGQLLSAPMILIGIYLLVRTHKRPQPSGNLGAVAQ
jgi:prolipoprotein diacylglyceryltransferase